MSNLNKIKEEGNIEFEEYFKEDKNGRNSIGLEYYDAPKKKFLDWHNKQMDKVYSLAIDDAMKVFENYYPDVRNTTDEIVVAIIYKELDVIKQKLLSLKNKEN